MKNLQYSIKRLACHYNPKPTRCAVPLKSSCQTAFSKGNSQSLRRSRRVWLTLRRPQQRAVFAGREIVHRRPIGERVFLTLRANCRSSELVVDDSARTGAGTADVCR